MRWFFVFLGAVLVSIGGGLAVMGAAKEAAMVGCTGVAIIALVMCSSGAYWFGLAVLLLATYVGLQFKGFPDFEQSQPKANHAGATRGATARNSPNAALVGE